MRTILALSAFCAACDPWFPTEFPVDVHVDSDLTQIQKDKSKQAVQEWNEAVGTKVLNLRWDSERIYRHTFHITNSMPPSDTGNIGAAESDPFKCTIHLGTTEHIQTIEHELGHCFGLRHDKVNMYSIMYPTIAVGQFITDDMVNFLLEKM